MTEIDQTFSAYRSGKTSRVALASSLREHLSAHPEAIDAVETQLNELLDDGVLSSSQHDSLTATVLFNAPPDPVSAELPPGTVIRERFVLEEVIGRGGMSVVYRARDRRREEAHDRHSLIAIKVLGDQFKDHPDAYVTLQREARRAQQLAHPNITTVFDFDREGDVPYLCMELLTGQSLEAVLRRPSVPEPAQARHIIQGMASGLEYAHARGIVHADFKPSNVFVTAENVVKILDFGIARVIPGAGSTSETVFDAGQLGALTPSYASCEMFERQAPDPRDDIYGLACVSYELLTGKHPFARKPATEARDEGLRPAPVAQLSRRQNQALLQGMAFDRASRTASAQAFYEALFADGTVGKGKLPGTATALLGLSAAVIGGLWLYQTQWNPGSAEAQKPAPVPIATDGDQGPDLDPELDADLDPELDGGKAAPLPVDAAVQARIERILFIADLHLQVGKLVDPPGTNAAEAYADALRLQPGNPEALKGLAATAEALVEEIRTLTEFGDNQLALEKALAGLEYLPDHEGLLTLKAELQLIEN